MKNLIHKFGSLVFTLACLQICTAQDSLRNNRGAVPAAELKKFETFIGSYSASVDWPTRNLKWDGSLEIAYSIKGWYIETNLIKESAGPHRQWRMMITWDSAQSKFRVWRFETTLPFAGQPEGVVKFDGANEWHAEWQNVPRADGKKVTYFSRFRLNSKDELDIITDVIDPDGKKEDVGIVRCKRKK